MIKNLFGKFLSGQFRVFCLVLALLLSGSFSALYAEESYLITETELTTLENNLKTYQEIANDLQKQTELQKKSLEKLEKERNSLAIKVGCISFSIGLCVGLTTMSIIYHNIQAGAK